MRVSVRFFAGRQVCGEGVNCVSQLVVFCALLSLRGIRECVPPPALASPRFRLAGQGVAFSLVRWGSEMRFFPLGEGGQTEWR